MFLSLNRDRDPFHHYHGLRREMDELLTPTLYMMQHMAPRLVVPKEDKSKNFQVKMDVQPFSPEELSVKMVEDCVLIEGKHEEKTEGDGFISRHIVRRYAIPQDVKPETITCSLSSDGQLLIQGPRAIQENKTAERNLPINYTGQPAVTNKEDKLSGDQPAPQKETTMGA
jgi:HSP20 family molecular chaperone IbpA